MRFILTPDKEERAIMAMPPNRGIAMGMGAVAAAVAEFEAELLLQSQGIRMRSIEYTCGAAQAPKGMTVCVPKDMPPAEIEKKINVENVTGNGSWWRVSPDKTCPCDHQPDRMHYLLLETVDR